MENVLVSLAKQLAVVSPTLLAYAVGMVLALVFWRRSPTACLLCLLGLALLFVTALVQPIVNHLVIRSVSTGSLDHQKVSFLLNMIGVIGSLARALGMGLLLGAVFSGRKKTKQVAVSDVLPVEESVPAKAANRGITRPLGGEAFPTNG